jgi:predicted methyltransferase
MRKSGIDRFELGGGSGWNAALIGQLVGPEGLVYCLVFIPDVAKTAAANSIPKEDSQMNLMERLEKTANDMAILSALSEMSGIPAEQLLQLSQESPEEFMALVQEAEAGRQRALAAFSAAGVRVVTA